MMRLANLLARWGAPFNLLRGWGSITIPVGYQVKDWLTFLPPQDNVTMPTVVFDYLEIDEQQLDAMDMQSTRTDPLEILCTITDKTG